MICACGLLIVLLIIFKWFLNQANQILLSRNKIFYMSFSSNVKVNAGCQFNFFENVFSCANHCCV